MTRKNSKWQDRASASNQDLIIIEQVEAFANWLDKWTRELKVDPSPTNWKKYQFDFLTHEIPEKKFTETIKSLVQLLQFHHHDNLARSLESDYKKFYGSVGKCDPTIKYLMPGSSSVTVDTVIENANMLTASLRRLTGMARSELTAVTEQKKKVEQPSNGDKAGDTKKPAKEPSKLENEAYQLYYTVGSTQKDVADKMSKEHKRNFNQGWVSRAVKKVTAWRKANNLPTDTPDRKSKPNTINLDPAVIDMGARTDGRLTGDPRHKKKTDYKH